MKTRIGPVLLLTLAAMLLTGAVPGDAASSHLGRTVPDQIALSWVDDPQTSIAIKWRTDTSVPQSVVEYWEVMTASGEPDDAPEADLRLPGDRRQAAGSSFEWTTNLGSMRIHEAQLSDLKPGQRYAYRIGDGSEDGWSPVHYFTTAPVGPTAVSVLVFGDSQSYPTDYGLWRKTLQTATRDDIPEQFVLHTGDLVDVGADELHWETWFAATRGVLESIPFLPALGNHENARGGSIYWKNHFQLPANGPQELAELAYSFNYGPVHVVVLDSEASGSALEAQKRFLEEDLARNQDKTWKIVAFHRTVHHVKWGRGNSDLLVNYVPILEKYGVDLVLNGHDHSYARSYPLRGGKAAENPTVLAAGSGIVYIVTGRSGVKTYTDTFRPQWAAAFGNGTRQPNYTNLIFEGRQVRVISRYLDGTIIDDVVLTK